MIQLQQPYKHQIKTTPVVERDISLGGIFIAIVIISLWAMSLFFLLTIDITKFKFWMLLTIIFGQTFLSTGLFITAHDAMHGVVFPQNIKINHFIGSLSVTLYGFLSYSKLLKKHWSHHHNPASTTDPDFHDGKHKNFFAWYFYFMKRYWSWRQMIGITIFYNIARCILHIPMANLNYFWVIPALLSSLQLFYFGTFLPHREPINGYISPHHAETINRPIWWSFITCYHFGYHKEHHEYPHLPWWQLPDIYKISCLIVTKDVGNG